MAEPSFIEFVERESAKAGCARTWAVVNRRWREYLGAIHWYRPWRRYCFSAAGDRMVFSPGCLRDIAQFCEERTQLHREGKDSEA